MSNADWGQEMGIRYQQSHMGYKQQSQHLEQKLNAILHEKIELETTFQSQLKKEQDKIVSLTDKIGHLTE